MLANQHMVTPHFDILRVRKSDVSELPSYSRVDLPEAQTIANERSQAHAVAPVIPAVKRMVPDRPAPSRTEEKEPGLFARLAKILFPHPHEEEKSKPVPTQRPAQQAGNQRQSQQNRQKQAKSSNRRGGNDRQGSSTQSNSPSSQPQRRTKKQQPRQAQPKPDEGQTEQQQTRQSKPAKKRSRRSKAKPASGAVNQAAQADTTVQATVPPTATAGEADGNLKPEQKESGNRRGSRRRRSPYKTGGAKPRAEQSESQSDSVTETSKQQPSASGDKQVVANEAQKPVQKEPRSTKPEATAASADGSDTKTSTPSVPATPAKQSEPKPAETKPTESNATEAKAAKTEPAASTQANTESTGSKAVKKTAATKAEDKKKTSKETPVDKTANQPDKPAKRKKRATRKKTSSKSADSTSGTKPVEDKAPAVAPKPSPVAAVEKDSKGIYTLKPPPSEHSSVE
jgi:ribonuclease E